MKKKRKLATVVGGMPAIANMTLPQKLAVLAMDGGEGNGSVAARYYSAITGEVDPETCIAFLRQQTERMQRGDMREVEASLYGQASALGAIFQSMAHRSAAHMGRDIELAERCMKLALKAQSQCRSTLETLAEIKNPRSVAFVRQANIANGHQQINNGQTTERAEKLHFKPNELQEIACEQPLAIGAATQGVRIDPRAATMVEVDRATNRHRKG